MKKHKKYIKKLTILKISKKELHLLSKNKDSTNSDKTIDFCRFGT